MFCPNCGTENEDAATTCKKCGFNLKGAAAPKFKGTMMMVNPPGVPRPAGPPAPGATPGAPPAAAPGAAPPGPALPPAARPQLRGTMLGVAPPGFGAPQPVAPPAPAAAAPQQPLGMQATAAFQQPPGGYGQQGPAPGEVNPLGGTMVADNSGFRPPQQPGQGGGHPPGGYGPAPGAPPGGFGPPPAGFGQAPSGFAPTALQPQMGQPPAAGGYGPPPGGPAAPGGFNPPPGYGAPPAGGPAPAGAGGFNPPHPGPSPGGYAPTAAFGAPGIVPAGPSAISAGYGPSGPTGPIGTERNPVMVLVVGYLCFVYAFIQMWGMLNELKAFRQKDDLKPILFIVPILGLIELWKLPEKVLDAKRMAGVPNPEVPHPILYLLLGLYFLPNDLNQVWQAAGRRSLNG